MKIEVRAMEERDIDAFADGFVAQGWHKSAEQYRRYLRWQREGVRKIYVGTLDGETAGYATLIENDENGPFKNMNIPTIVDFNVLEKYQKRGVGSAILDKIESDVSAYRDTVCLGVGLHSGYGSAQRMYVKRGYVPDGSGVWYENRQLEQYTPCINNDDLILYLSKKLK